MTSAEVARVKSPVAAAERDRAVVPEWSGSAATLPDVGFGVPVSRLTGLAPLRGSVVGDAGAARHAGVSRHLTRDRGGRVAPGPVRAARDAPEGSRSVPDPLRLHPRGVVPLRRMLIKYRAPGLPDVEDKESTAMTIAELDDVIAAKPGIYSELELNECLEQRIERELELIDKENLSLVNQLNDVAVQPAAYRANVDKLFQIEKELVPRLIRVTQGKKKQGDLAGKAKRIKEHSFPATQQAEQKLKAAGGSRGPHGVDPNAATLTTKVKEKPVPYKGATAVSAYLEPTDDSKKHVGDPGLRALVDFCGFREVELHWVVNALVGAKPTRPPSTDDWYALLDRFAKHWLSVKEQSRIAWAKHALLPTGVGLGPHYRGQFAELVEALNIIEAGQLRKGTQLTLGKDKQRPKVAALKENSKDTQDIDITLHHESGVRHYVEVKADPRTIVDKIGGDEDKTITDSSAVVRQGVQNPADPSLALDPDLLTTPDQVLSYEATKVSHELKAPNTTKPNKYPTGKTIVMMYSSPSLKDWLVIFTSKAARRLIKHHFELRLAGFQMNAVALQKIQDYVDAKTAHLDERMKKDWATTNSGTKPSDLLSGL